MGLLSMAGLIGRYTKITAKGGTAPMSLAECANLMLRTGDARAVLPPQQAAQVVELFQKYQTMNKRIPMDINDFTEAVAKMYREFDAIAPVEDYVNMNDMLTQMCVVMARQDTNINEQGTTDMAVDMLKKMYGI